MYAPSVLRIYTLDKRSTIVYTRTSIPVTSGLFIMEDAMARILVVDDEQPNRDMLCRVLELDNHAVETAENGLIALERLRAVAMPLIELVVSDFDMPKLDGGGLARAVRDDERLHGLPFIIVTGDRTRQNVFGVDAFLYKPLDFSALRATVAQLLQPRAPS